MSEFPSPFVQAAKSGNLHLVESLYDSDELRTALEAALDHNQSEVAHFLAQKANKLSNVEVVPLSDPAFKISKSQGHVVSSDMTGDFLHASIHPQTAFSTNEPRLDLYRPGYDADSTGKIGRLHIANFVNKMTTMIAALRRDKGSDVVRMSPSVYGNTRVFEVEVVTYNDASMHYEPSFDAEGEVVTMHTPDLNIAYTVLGNAGPILVMTHGVPANREQAMPVQKLLSKWFRTISFDLLGMGESSKPLNMPREAWDWRYDTLYFKILIDELVRNVSGLGTFFGVNSNERVFLLADDWGGGPVAHFMELFGEEYLLGGILLDPIAFDGYPVSEIETFGRLDSIFLNKTTSDAEKKQAFRTMAAGADQTMVQIFKTMVHNPDRVFNQYSLRHLKKTYKDVDYQRLKAIDGEDYTSLTSRLNFHALRVMVARSGRLAPAQLLPYAATENPRGVNYLNITIPVMVLWGELDNMMPANQVERFAFHMPNAMWFHGHKIADAGHFAAVDHPKKVAEEIIKFARNIAGTGPSNIGGKFTSLMPYTRGLADIFFGLDGIWKGDEKELFKHARVLYGLSYK